MVTKAQNRNSLNDTRLKMRAEKRLSRRMAGQLNEISTKAENMFIADRNILNISTFTDGIDKIIQSHYISTANIFKDRVNRKNINITDDEKLLLNNSIKKSAIARGNFSSNSITKNMQKDLENAFENSIPQVNEVKKTTRQIARDAGANFRRSVSARAKVTIPMTETQFAAEKTKLDTVTVHQSSSDNTTQKTFSKLWITRRDDKVREIHREADGEQEFVTNPFTVNGELLMFPGDTSLGASPGNTINCRCNSQFL